MKAYVGRGSTGTKRYVSRMENHIDHPLTLTVEQAARVLGIGRSTAYELVHTGDIPSLRLGRRIVVQVGQIADWLGMEPNDVQRVEPTRHSMTARPESRPPLPDEPCEATTLF